MIDHDIDIPEDEEEQPQFLDDRMSVTCDPLPISQNEVSLWSEAKGIDRLRKALLNIQLMCMN